MEHIRIPIAGTVVCIPRRITESDYELLMATLVLWKPNLVEKDKLDKPSEEEKK